MCNTVFRPNSYNGQTIDSYLRDALKVTSVRKQPKLTVGTLQRLAVHIDSNWLKDDVAEMLQEAVSSESGNLAIDLLIAPAVRTEADFRDCGSVVARIACSGQARLWRTYDDILADEATGKVAIVIDELQTVLIDPRSPLIWSEVEYRMIKERDHLGQGKSDRISYVAKTSIRLSGYSTSPSVPENYVTSVIRDFT